MAAIKGYNRKGCRKPLPPALVGIYSEEDYHKLSATRRLNLRQPEKRWEQSLKIRYNITFKDYSNLLKKQNNVCAICKKPEIREALKRINGTMTKSIVRLSVDHDHSCCPGRDKCCGNCIRGLLCYKCNTLLGRADDRVEILENAIKYLNQGAVI